jgi:hypothetical protein
MLVLSVVTPRGLVDRTNHTDSIFGAKNWKMPLLYQYILSVFMLNNVKLNFEQTWNPALFLRRIF